MAKKILYLTYDGLTDPLGQSQILPYVSGLTKEGYEFHILSFEKTQNLNKIGVDIQAYCDANKIVWHPLKFHDKPPVFAKYYDRWNFKRTALKLHKQHKFDMLHCRSYISSEIGLHFTEKLNVPFLFDMRGLWADEKKDAGHWDVSKPLYRKIYDHYKALEKQFVIKSAHIISLTLAGKNELEKLYGNDLKALSQSVEEKCTVIPCCADLELFDYNKITEEQKSKLRNELNIPQSAKVLTYNGSLGTWYMLPEMFDFFKVYKNVHPGAKFLVLTKDVPMLEDAFNKNLVQREDVVYRFVQKKDLPLYLSIGDASVYLIRNTYSKLSSSPTKHAELMGLGITIFCNEIGDTGNIMKNGNLGYLILPGDRESYKNAIEKSKNGKLSPPTIRNYACENFDLIKGVNLYINVYNLIQNAKKCDVLNVN